MNKLQANNLHAALEALYSKYNRRRFVHPDPLEFLYNYENPADMEIAGLVASSLAYGRVAQILNSVRRVLDALGPSPAARVTSEPSDNLDEMLSGFKHRFTTGRQLTAMLAGAGRLLAEYGSLEACFAQQFRKSASMPEAQQGFVALVERAAGTPMGFLLPCPSRGSTCKRLNLFLKWMVRRDDVDPGPWTAIPASSLVVPLDTHMFRTGHRLGLLRRKQSDLKAALELTEGFAKLEPEDPAKYDFVLTRFGIRRDFCTLEEAMRPHCGERLHYTKPGCMSTNHVTGKNTTGERRAGHCQPWPA